MMGNVEKRRQKSGLVLMVLLLAMVLCACGATGSEQTADIAVLYTNDVHCAMEGPIGYAGLAAFKQELLDDGSEVLLVDVGDTIQGSPIGSLSQGKIPIEMMNKLGYHGMALGNHDFGYGLENLQALSQQADFPFLSLNFVEKASGDSVYSPYTILERGGVKIAFVGVSTPKTLTSTTPKYFTDDTGEFIYSFLQDESGETLWQATQNAVDQAKKEGAQYVVALTHLGVGDFLAPYTSTELISHTSGIDVVLDGHSHSVIECQRVKNKDGQQILLSSTGTGFEHIGYLLIDKNGNLSTGLITDYAAKDEATANELTNLQGEFEQLLAQPVTDLAQTLVVNDPASGERLIRHRETNLGDLCADAIRSAAGADIAIINGGGMRADLPIGAVTNGDLLSVFPFGNDLCTIEVSGAQLLDALEMSVRVAPAESGGFLQVSGLTFAYRSDIPSAVQLDQDGMFSGVNGERRVQDVLVAGQPLALDGRYTLAGTEFTLRNGGDGYSMFAGVPVLTADAILDFDVLATYLTEHYPAVSESYQMPYGEGRIVALP